MVLSAITIAALAPLTGALFGASYGTAIRIGYEIIFPSLFGDKKLPVPTDAKATMKAMEGMYTKIGGLEAHKFGIQQGMNLALSSAQSKDGVELVNLAMSEMSPQVQGGSGQVGTTRLEAESGMTAQEIKTRRARHREIYPESYGIVLEGDYVDGDGQVRNDLLDHMSMQRLNTYYLLIKANTVPINWPSNWIKLIPQYISTLANKRYEARFAKMGNDEVVKTPPPPTVPKTDRVSDTPDFQKKLVNDLIRQLSKSEDVLKRAETALAKKISERRAIAQFYGNRSLEYRVVNAQVQVAERERDKALAIVSRDRELVRKSKTFTATNIQIT